MAQGKPLWLDERLLLPAIMAKKPPISLPTLNKKIKAGEFKGIIFKSGKYNYLNPKDWDKFLAVLMPKGN